MKLSKLENEKIDNDSKKNLEYKIEKYLNVIENYKNKVNNLEIEVKNI